MDRQTERKIEALRLAINAGPPDKREDPEAVIERAERFLVFLNPPPSRRSE